jgi:hypothetical protein
MGRDLVDGIRVDKVGLPAGNNVAPQPQTPPPQAQSRRDDLDDEIPF